MPADTDKIKGGLSLDAMATTPNASKRTLKEKIAEPETYDLIRKAELNKYTHAEIAVALKGKGIEIKADTLALYLRQIAIANGEREAKPSTKAKAAKAKPAAASSEGTAADAKRTGGDKPAGNGGKTLTKPPTMGGAFNDSDL